MGTALIEGMLLPHPSPHFRVAAFLKIEAADHGRMRKTLEFRDGPKDRGVTQRESLVRALSSGLCCLHAPPSAMAVARGFVVSSLLGHHFQDLFGAKCQ